MPHTIQGPAGEIGVDDGGAGGLPVVFVHSFGGSSRHWAAQLAHLRPRRRAVALDLRGHGTSQAPEPRDYTPAALAADIGAVVDGLDLARFVLVGHSMGGSAAIAYAGEHPERVAGLVLAGTPGRTPPEASQPILASMRENYEAVSEKYWTSLLANARPRVEALVRADMRRVPPEDGLAIIEAIFAFDPLPALRAYAGPKLLVDTPHGDSPGSLHEQAPEIPRRVVHGTSHWLQLDAPEEFDRILDAFLATVG